MTPRTTLSGKHVLAAVLALIFAIAFGVMGIALVTRRPPAPPPMPRGDTAPTRPTEPATAAPIAPR